MDQFDAFLTRICYKLNKTVKRGSYLQTIGSEMIFKSLKP